MKIFYEPTGIKDFHNQGGLSFRVSGETSGDNYIISRGQARRAQKHFCGMSDCRCPAGAVQQLTEDGSEWGLPIIFCE